MSEILETGKSVDTPAQCRPKPTYRILVVDDDIQIRRFVVRVLTTSGYRVDTAEDGAIGWHSLHGNSYDLLITDHQMPKVTGVELVRAVRSARMTSGAIPTAALEKDPSLRIVATLPKPFTVEELLGTVRKVLRA